MHCMHALGLYFIILCIAKKKFSNDFPMIFRETKKNILYVSYIAEKNMNLIGSELIFG